MQDDDPDDPLAEFRRPGDKRGEKPRAPQPPPLGLKPYLAFEAKDKLQSLDIRQVLGPTHAPTYAYLLNIVFDHEYYTGFMLFFSFMVVKARGKNLKEVINAIKMRKCEYIQDFHPGEYQPPKPGDPVIESIVVEWRDPMMTGRDTKTGKGEDMPPAGGKPSG
jgi:hypothetical protein